MRRRDPSRKNLLTVALSEDDVACIAGPLAELFIAVNETKVIEQDSEHVARLAEAQRLVDQWRRVFRLRSDLARAEAAAGPPEGTEQ